MNNNLDENTMNKIKNMVDNGDISSAISQISPEMIQNFSKMLSNSQNEQGSNTQNQNQNTYSKDKQANYSSVNNNNYNSKSNSNSNFDFSNIDMNTILKMKSIMEKMNNSNDSRSNLLQSLKPYLRETKQEKLDQYANLLKVANIAELMKNDKKGDFK